MSLVGYDDLEHFKHIADFPSQVVGDNKSLDILFDGCTAFAVDLYF
jgi:hypothetical protein